MLKINMETQPIFEFKELNKNLLQEMNNYPLEKKLKGGGEYKTIISELALKKVMIS